MIFLLPYLRAENINCQITNFFLKKMIIFRF